MMTNSFHILLSTNLNLRRYIQVGAEVEATNMEPDKCEGWEWLEWGDTVPTPRFLPLDIILKDPNYKPV